MCDPDPKNRPAYSSAAAIVPSDSAKFLIGLIPNRPSNARPGMWRMSAVV
jgi:hypothetical protein